MRAREPDSSGFVDNAGVRLYHESFGAGPSTLLLMPTTPLQHSRMWKGQVPYLSRYARVITYDGRGNGRSDRPTNCSDYTEEAFVSDAAAVMDALRIDRATVAGLCDGARQAMMLAAKKPERVAGLVLLAPAVPVAPKHPNYLRYSFDEELDTEEGWAKCNRHYWLRDFEKYLDFFFAEMIPEAHSSKQIEDGVEWALEASVETHLAAEDAPVPWSTLEEIEAAFDCYCRQVQCPVLIIHGSEDACQLPARGIEVAGLTEGELVMFEGTGHVAAGRDPVKVNGLIRDFLARSSVAGDRTRSASRVRRWSRSLSRPRRALFVSSPIGLGHIQRDLAIARQLRELVPDLEIHWWTQHPATAVLERAGETIHPACGQMASESRHWEAESAGHGLHAFYAFRRMDEIFVANFMLFHDVTREEQYDLWIGDESWEVDFFLHENPELKTAPYAFLTDVIGFLPVAQQEDPREAIITADYNSEMIEQRARFPRLRDLSLYVGEFDDLPQARFGPDLPVISDWARDWFEEVGYVLPFEPEEYRDRSRQRELLGYPKDVPLLFAAVGGTSIGRSLLERTAEAFGLLHERRPEVQMVMVTGPRIDPGDLPEVEGLRKLPYVHDLFEHLACADGAVVQGGLSTTMELVGLQLPFLYFPLRGHWEQMHHVQHRLERYGAGLGLDYSATSAEDLSEELERLLDLPVEYRKIAPGAAHRAAERIASLLRR